MRTRRIEASMPDTKTSKPGREHRPEVAHNFYNLNTGRALLSDSPGHGHFRRETTYSTTIFNLVYQTHSV